jgi:hypothetical protein
VSAFLGKICKDEDLQAKRQKVANWKPFVFYASITPSAMCPHSAFVALSWNFGKLINVCKRFNTDFSHDIKSIYALSCSAKANPFHHSQIGALKSRLAWKEFFNHNAYLRHVDRTSKNFAHFSNSFRFTVRRVHKFRKGAGKSLQTLQC